MEKLKYWVWYSSLVKITPKVRHDLLECFGSPENIWHLGNMELEVCGLIDTTAIGIIHSKVEREKCHKIYEKAIRLGMEIITIRDKNYPELLKNIYDPPCVLYTYGKLIQNETKVAVIGSRKATRYGLEISGTLSRAIASSGVCIVSGMARGIDSRAHTGALEAMGRTIAVLGCGADIVYPEENKGLVSRITQKGAVVSEYIPGTPPVQYNFPARNRIISGMSEGVLIIEAGEKSGTLITVNYALEQGRDVFAVPGNINSINSRGTNRLIRDGAFMVLEASDILDELGISYNVGGGIHSASIESYASEPGKNKGQKHSYVLDPDELDVLKKLKQNEPVHIDSLSRICRKEVNEISAILVMLEMKGLVEQIPGKRFLRIFN